MSFKDVIASDVHDTFMNADEFSDMHDLNGKMMPVQATDYGPMPKQGSLIQFDKKPYKVADAISEDGIYSITLEANRA